MTVSLCASASLRTDVLPFWLCLFSVKEYVSLKKGDRLEWILSARRCAKANGGDYLERLYSFFYLCVCILRVWIISSLDIMTMDSKVRYYM